MNIKNELAKTIRTTRTYKFRAILRLDNQEKFKHAQKVQRLYFNYALKYLYQHYGANHLNNKFPIGKAKQYLVRSMIDFARNKATQHNFNLKQLDYSVQSISKTLENLLVAFQYYRFEQYKLTHYWSNKEKQNYLKNHKCSLSGYSRINYKHNDTDFKSVTLKQNHNCIRLINNYAVKLPFFGIIQVKQSLTNFKRKKIIEARLKKRTNGDFELQLITKFIEKRNITKAQITNIVGLDVNSKDDKFFTLSDGTPDITWSKQLKRKYQLLDKQTRYLQGIINKHNHGNDNSKIVRKAKQQIAKTKAKMLNIIDNWQLNIAQQLVEQYPVLAMEQLNSFSLRISKRNKNYKLRKNTNHKLATIQPTSFRQMMEYIYQDHHCLLFEVNTIDTSKTCHNCGYINHKLKHEKHWQCPNCNKNINRDLNATYNIRDWALHPEKHAALKQPKRFPWLSKDNVIKTY